MCKIFKGFHIFHGSSQISINFRRFYRSSQIFVDFNRFHIFRFCRSSQISSGFRGFSQILIGFKNFHRQLQIFIEFLRIFLELLQIFLEFLQIFKDFLRFRSGIVPVNLSLPKIWCYIFQFLKILFLSHFQKCTTSVLGALVNGGKVLIETQLN